MSESHTPYSLFPLVLRRPQVEQITGLGRSTIYEWMKDGRFPLPIKLGARAVAWRQADILAWLESRQPRTAA
jgi:prophage regulatory protein